MFKLANASIHYGSRSNSFTGLEARFGEIADLDSLDLDALAAAVARATGFSAPFRADLHARVDLVALAEKAGVEMTPTMPREIPERIVAMANGYTITWNKADEAKKHD